MDAISCLAPPPSALLPTSCSYTDAAIARALHFSTTMSPGDSSASASASSLSHHHSPLLADLPSPYYAPPPHHAVAATCCDSVLVSDVSPRRRSSPNQNRALAPAGARAGKRRSRASKRAPTTYISTDAANFRIMVQQITGVQADMAAGDLAGVDVMMLQVQATALLGSAAAAAGNTQLLQASDEASALRQHQQQQQPCFPTLDSWNVMYEASSACAEML